MEIKKNLPILTLMRKYWWRSNCLPCCGNAVEVEVIYTEILIFGRQNRSSRSLCRLFYNQPSEIPETAPLGVPIPKPIGQVGGRNSMNTGGIKVKMFGQSAKFARTVTSTVEVLNLSHIFWNNRNVFISKNIKNSNQAHKNPLLNIPWKPKFVHQDRTTDI